VTDKEKAVFLTIALTAFETVRESETPKSAKYTRLTRSMDVIAKHVDFYLPEPFNAELLDRASKLVDSFNRKIKKEFGGLT